MMKIAQIYPGSVPPEGYGGIERMVFWLAKEISSLGHEVIIVAKKGQEQCLECGISFIEWSGEYSQLEDILPRNVDIVHYHQQVSQELLPNIPFIVTQHGNQREKVNFLPNTLFISQSHANIHGSDHFVYNGIPTDEYPLVTSKNNHLLFMALISWEKKNIRSAVNLALDTDMPIDVCGGKFWTNQKISRLWKYAIKKRNAKSILTEQGNVDGKHKLHLLQRSSLLFYAANWHEPFALAPHEALACGTPVLTSPNGAFPEYIRHAENGYIVNSYEEAIQALKEHSQLSTHAVAKMAKNCRDSAFTIKDSAKSYISYYHEILGSNAIYSDAELQKLKYRRKKIIKIKKH